jgi:hypothetical protein
MEFNAKPTETDIVLVHDKILMALLGANGIKPVHVCMTGWPNEPHGFERESYLAYRHTLKVVQLIEEFEQRKVNVNLNDYLDSATELEGYLGEIVYWPKSISHSDMAAMLDET